MDIFANQGAQSELGFSRGGSVYGYQGVALGSENRRHGNSEWLLGYREFPFRAISSFEQVREASYYLVSTDATGAVTHGRLVNEVLERRITGTQQ